MTLIERLKAKIAKLNKRHGEVFEELLKEADNEKRAALGETLKALKEDISEAEAMLKEAEAKEPANNGNGDNGAPAQEGRSATVAGATFNPAATFGVRGATAPAKEIDKFDTPEYRKAFMEYACRGVAIPAEFREAGTTTTADAGAVIPTTIVNEIIRELKVYGNVFSQVRKLNVQGGMQIPVLSLKPVATWIGESTPSDDQKVGANDKVSFSYFGLECKIAQTLLASITTIEAFQALFVPLAVEAIAKALDIAILNGAGTASPLGITKDTRVPAANTITLSATDFGTWGGWKKKVFAKMKKAYRKGTFFMAQGTFDGYIDGMEDTNGQPIGRVNYGIDGGETYRFGGKNVETVEDDVIANYEDAATGDIVAVFVNLSDYVINSNMQMVTHKWIDRDTNEVKTQVILICDGKLADPNGVLIIKKGA